MKYVVVYEKAPNNYAAYVPDLPGCVATGATREEVEGLIHKAMKPHVESLRQYGEPVPRTGIRTELVEVPAS